MGNMLSQSTSCSGSSSMANGNGLDGVYDRTSRGGFVQSPLPITRSTSEAVSFKSYRSACPEGADWNEQQMLIFIDEIRRVLANCHKSPEENTANLQKTINEFEVSGSLFFRQISNDSRKELLNLVPGLLGILNMLVTEERSGQKRVGMDFIVHTHIDMLLTEIQRYAENLTSRKDAITQAAVLERAWMERFGTNWWLIASQRNREAKVTGVRRDLVSMMFPTGWQVGDEVGWNVRKIAPGADTEGTLGFPAGQWWVNIYCALRDGVVSSPTVPETRGRSGVTALSMLTGQEIEGVYGTVEYTKEGFKRDMPIRLLSNRCPIRVLRGSRLKSKFAPVVGVRYDGLYMVKKFSWKMIDDTQPTWKYECRIVLERVAGQADFDDVLKHPTHSEQDHFELYWSHVSAGVLDWLGEERFKVWRNGDPDESWYSKRREAGRKQNVDE